MNIPGYGEECSWSEFNEDKMASQTPEDAVLNEIARRWNSMTRYACTANTISRAVLVDYGEIERTIISTICRDMGLVACQVHDSFVFSSAVQSTPRAHRS